MKAKRAAPGITADHVERLSRGKRSGGHVGSRGVGHHLTALERSTYQRALKTRFLVLTTKDRANLWHIWEKCCEARQWPFLVLIKNTADNQGVIYEGQQPHDAQPLVDAKNKIRLLAQQ